MNTAIKIFSLTFLLASCASMSSQEKAATLKLSLTDRVQAQVVEMQKSVTEALPEEIAGLKSVEPVADREQNQKGAGFTRAYTAGDIVATVFIYNNQDFGVPEEINENMEALMDKHLQEIQAMQDSGLYSAVKIGNKKTRNFRWRGVNYQVLEADVQFNQREEPKKSLLVLGSNKDLMTYVRIRYTYPKSKQAEINRKHAVFTRTVFVALRNFAQAQKTPVAQ